MTTKPYYECHVTMWERDDNAREVEGAVNAIGWTFSRIDNDITLGAGVKMYATRHFNAEKNSLDEVKATLREVVVYFQQLSQLKVIRSKIELVVFDERY